MTLLSKRIRGLPIEEAAQVLHHDHAALEQWLSTLGEEADPLHFAQGFFLTASPEELARRIMEETEKPTEPKPCLHFELPPGAKRLRVPGDTGAGMLVSRKGVWLVLEALSEEGVANLADATWRDSGRTEYTILQVSFGSVTGRKFLLERQTPDGPYKEIAYALTVPGGHVYATMSPIGKNVLNKQWDETPFEACLHTLRVETKSPSAPDKP